MGGRDSPDASSGCTSWRALDVASACSRNTLRAGQHQTAKHRTLALATQQNRHINAAASYEQISAKSGRHLPQKY